MKHLHFVAGRALATATLPAIAQIRIGVTVSSTGQAASPDYGDDTF